MCHTLWATDTASFKVVSLWISSFCSIILLLWGCSQKILIWSKINTFILFKIETLTKSCAYLTNTSISSKLQQPQGEWNVLPNNKSQSYEGMSPCPLISRPQNLPFLIQTIYTKLAFNLLASTHLHSYLAHGSLHFFSSSLIFFLFFQFFHQLHNVEGHVTLFQEFAVSFRIDLSIHQHVCICWTANVTNRQSHSSTTVLHLHLCDKKLVA